jgi:fructosamine-3-kinase
LRTPDAADRMRGEYTSMVEIFNTVPSFAPQPLGYGQCDQDPDAHFFLCEYLTIDHVLPDPVSLGKNLAELHRKSQSPTGKFGFHCTTFDGKLPLNTTWDSDWKSFFTTLMCDVYKLDVEINGFWKELDDAMQVMLHKLIPRLLDPLTADGRTVKPCLIHDDLWEGNIGTDTATGRVFVFDACAYYAHHEKEMGMWRCGNHAMSDGRYREEYFRNYPPSEPVEEADDRNRLYCVQTMLMHSAHYPGKGSREKALEEITWLREKYCRDM